MAPPRKQTKRSRSSSSRSRRRRGPPAAASAGLWEYDDYDYASSSAAANNSNLNTIIEPPSSPLKITKTIRNDDPSRIDEVGFVEVERTLSKDLVERILDEAEAKVRRHLEGGGASAASATASTAGEAAPSPSPSLSRPSPRKRSKGGARRRRSDPRSSARSAAAAAGASPSEVEEISNALQLDLSDALLEEVRSAMAECDRAAETMRAVFGKRGPPPLSSSPSPWPAAFASNDDDDDDDNNSSRHGGGSIGSRNGNDDDDDDDNGNASPDENDDDDSASGNIAPIAATTTTAALPAATATTPPPTATESNYRGFVVENAKVLVAPPGSRPQLPHADDHCTSCVICIVHLKDGQEPTRVVSDYNGGGGGGGGAGYGTSRTTNGRGIGGGGFGGSTAKDYPTGITVTCDVCGREEQLPDEDFRRGVHLTDEGWRCRPRRGRGAPRGAGRAPADSSGGIVGDGDIKTDAGGDGDDDLLLLDGCSSPHVPYDFEGKMIAAFGELLRDDAPSGLCDAYAGNARPRAGDGVLGLPTLVHRGPGCPEDARGGARYVLFFTLSPTYGNLRREMPSEEDAGEGGGEAASEFDNDRGGDDGRQRYHRYNPALQVHAPRVLYALFRKVRRAYERGGCGGRPLERCLGAVAAAAATTANSVGATRRGGGAGAGAGGTGLGSGKLSTTRRDHATALAKEVAKLKEENEKLRKQLEDAARDARRDARAAATAAGDEEFGLPVGNSIS